MNGTAAKEAGTERFDKIADSTNGIQVLAIWVAVFGVPAAVVWDASWYISAYAGLYVVTVEVTWLLYAAYLKAQIFFRRREIARIQETIRQLETVALQQQILITETQAHKAALRAEVSAMRTELAEKDRLQSQLRSEVATQELLAEQRKTKIAIQRLEIAQLEARAEWAECRIAQAKARLEHADSWRTFARSAESAQDQILNAYRKGFEHGKQGVSFSTMLGRHLRLVEDSA
jgi:hypothetical protein